MGELYLYKAADFKKVKYSVGPFLQNLKNTHEIILSII